jgi:hypothetical protein
VEAELVLEATDAEARRVGGDDEGADLGAVVLVRARPGGDDVRARLAGVRDEALAAVDDPRAPPSEPSSWRDVVRVPPASEPAPGSVSP